MPLEEIAPSCLICGLSLTSCDCASMECASCVCRHQGHFWVVFGMCGRCGLVAVSHDQLEEPPTIRARRISR
jgi:hypothetical protein